MSGSALRRSRALLRSATSSPWSAQTQVKFAAIYNLPLGIQTSATMQSYPGSDAELPASRLLERADCAVARPQSVVVRRRRDLQRHRGHQLVPSNADLRGSLCAVRCPVREERQGLQDHVQGILDVFNAFNARPVLGVITRYSGATGGSWLSPTTTLVGRLIKFSAQVNF